MLLRTHRTVAEHATEWARTACAIKGIDPDGALAGEEWLSGPYAVLGALAAYAATVDALLRGRGPLDGFPIVDAPGGRRAVRVLPRDRSDRLLLSGLRADVWFPPGVGDDRIRRTAGLAQLDPTRNGGVGLVLGAGNITSIPPLDVLDQLLAHGRACLLKLNPITGPLLPVFRSALAPLVEAGLLRVHADEGLGPYLVRHRAVQHIHLTGSSATYHAILHGSDRSEDAVIRTPVTAELGGVAPIVVVPGAWSAADLRHQAEHVATMRLHNNGYNCIAGQVLVLSADWPQRAAFLDEVRAAMLRAPRRPDYYPGSADRVHAAAQSHRGVIDLGGRLILTDLGPADPACRTEYFAPVLGVTVLPGTGLDFLRRAVDFANDRLAGTLGANIIALPQQVRTPSFRRTLVDLRYGTIGVNAWTGVGFLTARAPWGAYPDETLTEPPDFDDGGGRPEDAGSGIGFVHNALLLDRPERTVVTGPFRVFPRSLLHGERSLLPRPPWFVGNRTATATCERLTRFAADPRWWRIPPILSSALRG